jgi:hypothetical protein
VNLKLRNLIGAALAACFVFAILATAQAAEAKCPSKLVSIDHVIWAVPDLEEYADKFENMTGVAPVYGGEHTNGITANYLMALDNCTYLEIIGPKKGVSLDTFGEAAAIYKNTGLLGFAFGMQNADDAKDYFARIGLSTDEPRTGGRNKPDGSFVGWRTIRFPTLNFGTDSLLFAIEWTTVPHPATTSPKGIKITNLVIEGPDAGRLARIVQDHDLPVEIAADRPIGFKLMLETPKGRIVLD